MIQSDLDSTDFKAAHLRYKAFVMGSQLQVTIHPLNETVALKSRELMKNKNDSQRRYASGINNLSRP